MNSVRFQVAKPPKTSVAAEGILLDPVQTIDDVVEKVNEESPTFTLLATQCNTETEFDKTSDVKVLSFAWAIPHLVEPDQDSIADDARGAIVELMRTGVSFKNVSTQAVTLHANTPIARQHYPGKIYTRLSGFHAKGKKKSVMSDDLVLNPNQTGTFKINWKSLPNEYTSMTQVVDGRYWMNMLTFSVVIKNINEATGASFSDNASILELRPKALYTKRKSNPLPADGKKIIMQSEENFALQKMAGGFGDLYAVDPVSTKGGSRRVATADIGGSAVPADLEIFTGGNVDVSFIADAVREGDLIGVTNVMATKMEHGREIGYQTAGLETKRVGGTPRPLELRSRQGIGTRIMLYGLSVAAQPPPTDVTMSYFKWDQKSGYWVLWDDFENLPRYSPDTPDFTPISSAVPLTFLDGVYTKEEQEAMLNEMVLKGYNDYGQPYGSPKAFGDFLRTAISVLVVVGKVAGFIGEII